MGNGKQANNNQNSPQDKSKKFLRKQTVREFFDVVNQNMAEEEKEAMAKRNKLSYKQSLNLEKIIEKSPFMQRFINTSTNKGQIKPKKILDDEDPIEEQEKKKL